MTSRLHLYCQPMLAAFILLLPAANSEAGHPRRAQDTWTFTFIFENDLFAGRDESYTNGLKFSWISPDLTEYRDSDRLPAWSLPIVERLPLINEPGLQRNIALSFGHKMFTPTDIRRRDLIEDDQPYAAWLYGGAAFHNKSQARLDTFEIQLGMIGPVALGGEIQNFVHGLRDMPKARGWDNQLHNEPGIMLIAEQKRRLMQRDLVSRFGFDVIGHLGGAAGNVYTYLNTGLEARLGWNIPVDFGTTIIRPGGDTNAPLDSGDPRLSQTRSFSLHLFAAVSGSWMLRNIFLDGNTFRDSHSVDKRPLTADVIVGTSVVYRRVKISYAHVFRTSEFRGQDSSHEFGSISLSYTF
jgi:lipid A 3-O-deacylase